MAKAKGGYILTFYSRRSTPRVHRAGTKPPKPKKGWGKRVSSRRANAKESAKASRGKWIQVDSKGRTPSSSKYKPSQYRPKLGAKRRATNARLRRRGR